MENKNFQNLFGPARLVYFVGENAAGSENAEKKEAEEAIKEYEKKIEAPKILSSENVEKAYNEAIKKIDEVQEKASASLNGEEKNDLLKFILEQQQQLANLKDKYTQRAKKEEEEEFEQKKMETAKTIENLGGENVAEVKLNTPKDYRKNAAKYVKDDGSTIDFGDNEAAQKAVRLVDIVKNPGIGDKIVVRHKGKEVIATYNGKDFVDDKKIHVPIVSGDKIETGAAVAEKEKGPKEKAEMTPEQSENIKEAVKRLMDARNRLVDLTRDAYIAEGISADEQEYLEEALDKEYTKINKAIEEVKINPDLASTLVGEDKASESNRKDFKASTEAAETAMFYTNTEHAAWTKFIEMKEKYPVMLAKKEKKAEEKPLVEKGVKEAEMSQEVKKDTTIKSFKAELQTANGLFDDYKKQFGGNENWAKFEEEAKKYMSGLEAQIKNPQLVQFPRLIAPEDFGKSSANSQMESWARVYFSKTLAEAQIAREQDKEKPREVSVEGGTKEETPIKLANVDTIANKIPDTVVGEAMTGKNPAFARDIASGRANTELVRAIVKASGDNTSAVSMNLGLLETGVALSPEISTEDDKIRATINLTPDMKKQLVNAYLKQKGGA